jgi:hypothetical protein
MVPLILLVVCAGTSTPIRIKSIPTTRKKRLVLLANLLISF